MEDKSIINTIQFTNLILIKFFVHRNDIWNGMLQVEREGRREKGDIMQIY